MLDGRGDELFAMTDVLAARARKIAGTTVRSIRDIASRQGIADDGAVGLSATG